jgi:DNA-binding PadR family transcriptional regulator
MHRERFARGFRGHDDHHRGGWGDRKRQRRGDIKFILLALIKEQPRHGYELIKELERRYGGFYRPSPGSVYPTLQMLEDEGHVSSDTVDGKRTYAITESGLKLLADHERDAGDAPWGGEKIPQFIELRVASAALMESVMHATRFASPEQVTAIRQVLEKATQEVHTILANKPGDPTKI